MRVDFGELSLAERSERERSNRPAPNLQRAIANVPAAASAQFDLLKACSEGLSDQTRELVIMAVAVATGNAYCWGHHLPWLQKLEYTPKQIDALRLGDTSPFSGREASLVEFAWAVERLEVDDRVWAETSRVIEPEEMIRVTLLVGCYGLISRVQSAWDVPQDEGFGGFE
jgi:alkylhydroperoxidase family enzyme